VPSALGPQEPPPEKMSSLLLFPLMKFIMQGIAIRKQGENKEGIKYSREVIIRW